MSESDWALTEMKARLAEMTNYAYELGLEKHQLVKERDEARDVA